MVGLSVDLWRAPEGVARGVASAVVVLGGNSANAAERPRSAAETVLRSPGSTPLSTDVQISGRAKHHRAEPDLKASNPTDSHHWSIEA